MPFHKCRKSGILRIIFRKTRNILSFLGITMAWYVYRYRDAFVVRHFTERRFIELLQHPPVFHVADNDTKVKNYADNNTDLSK